MVLVHLRAPITPDITFNFPVNLLLIMHSRPAPPLNQAKHSHLRSPYALTRPPNCHNPPDTAGVRRQSRSDGRARQPRHHSIDSCILLPVIYSSPSPSKTRK